MRKIDMILVPMLVLLVACSRATSSPPSPPTASTMTLSTMTAPTTMASTSTPSEVTPTATVVTPTLPAADKATLPEPGEEARFAGQRERMVAQTIERRGVRDENVLRAMRTGAIRGAE